jgi:hypothetical protein
MTNTPIRLVVTVQFVRLAKGFWGFVDADGNKWRAAKVPEELQKEGAKAEIMAIPLPDVFSIYMWGTEIDVQSYTVIS